MPAAMLLRADADRRIAAGHAMRCLALARAWQAAGGEATFVSHCPVEGLRRRIISSGAKLIELERPHGDPADLATVRQQPAPAWTVLDGYHFDADYHQAVRRAAKRLLAIDDAVRLEHYHADVVLNQNLGAEELHYSCDEGTTQLLGCRWALLRPEFQQWQSFRREHAATARRLLITFGGADPHNLTLSALRVVELLDLPELEVKVVVGSANPNLETLLSTWGRFPNLPKRPDQPIDRQVRKPAPRASNIELLSDVADMSALMAWADVALSAAGSTCWELMFMQLPAAVVVAADNQQPIAESLAGRDLATNLGRAEDLDPKTVAGQLAQLCRNRTGRARRAEAGRRLVDGCGAERVVRVLRALDGELRPELLAIRPAADDDLLPIWRLRNQPTVRAASLDPVAIPLPEHTAWFRRQLLKESSRIWVLDYQGLILGVIRYDRTVDDAAQVSLYTAQAFRRRGLALRLLDATSRPACNELDVTRLRAIVRSGNAASQQFFAKAGFARVTSGVVENQQCLVLERVST